MSKDGLLGVFPGGCVWDERLYLKQCDIWMSFRGRLVSCVRGPLVSMSAVSGAHVTSWGRVNVQMAEMRIE